jgi:Ca2+/H+ antiporter
MNHILLSIEILSLVVIVGGGIVLGGGVRPQFIKAMQQSIAVNELESLHISIWNAYNRFSLMAVIIFLLLQVSQLFIIHQFHLISLSVSIILFLLFIFKIMMDAKLKKRAIENIGAADSEEQRKNHKVVEFLSIVILFIATIEIFLIH